MISFLQHILVQTAYAQTPCAGLDVCDPGAVPGTIQSLIAAIGGVMVATAAGAAVFFVAWGGAQMIVNMGDESKGTEGRKNVISALVGFLLVLASESLVNEIVSEFFDDGYIAGANPFTYVMGQVVEMMYILFNVTFVAMVVYAGYLMVLSRGAEEQYNKGKTTLIWAVAGAVIINVATYVVESFLFF